MQRLLSLMRRAVSDHKMIDDGDKIVVGVSGGKDSLTLLNLLAAYRRFSPERFTLVAVTIDMGFTGADFSRLREHCASIDVPFELIKSDIYDIVFVQRKEKNPCSLCANMRRGILSTACNRLNANKLALGHTADDCLETFLLSLIYEGRLSTIAPAAYMSRSNITLIRPLIYMDEKNVIAYAERLPIMKNPCPKNHASQREYMKNLIKSIKADVPIAKERMLSALFHPERNNLWDKSDNRKSNPIMDEINSDALNN